MNNTDDHVLLLVGKARNYDKKEIKINNIL